MQLTDLLQQTGGLSSIAKELGLSESQASSGAGALLPAILGGLQNPTSASAAAPGGGLGGLLSQLGGGGLLDSVLSNQPTDVSRGNDLLGHIFGDKDTSRAVAQQAAGTSGLDPALLKKMLPMVAMLVGGYLAKNAAGGGAGGLGGLLGSLGNLGGTGGANNPLGSLLGKLGR